MRQAISSSEPQSSHHKIRRIQQGLKVSVGSATLSEMMYNEINFPIS